MKWDKRGIQLPLRDVHDPSIVDQDIGSPFILVLRIGSFLDRVQRGEINF